MASSKYTFAVDTRRVKLSSLLHPYARHDSTTLSNNNVDPSPAGPPPAHRFLTLRTHATPLSDTCFEHIIFGQVRWLIDVMKHTEFCFHRIHLLKLISSTLSKPGRLLLIRRGNWSVPSLRFKAKSRIAKGAFQLCLGSRRLRCIVTIITSENALSMNQRLPESIRKRCPTLLANLSVGSLIGRGLG